MSGTSSSRHYHVYGGPEGGTLASVHPRATTYVYTDPRGRNVLRYSYVLVPASDRGKAFVPEHDDQLRLAFQRTSGEPGDRESETLAAEIQRRGLDV